MENKYNITDAELEIMKELWENKQLSLNELTEKLNKKEPRNKNTIKTLLYRLIEIFALNSFSFWFLFMDFTAPFSINLYNGNTSNMLLNFVENKEISKEELKKLIEMIED